LTACQCVCTVTNGLSNFTDWLW